MENRINAKGVSRWLQVGKEMPVSFLLEAFSRLRVNFPVIDSNQLSTGLV